MLPDLVVCQEELLERLGLGEDVAVEGDNLVVAQVNGLQSKVMFFFILKLEFSRKKARNHTLLKLVMSAVSSVFSTLKTIVFFYNSHSCSWFPFFSQSSLKGQINSGVYTYV